MPHIERLTASNISKRNYNKPRIWLYKLQAR